MPMTADHEVRRLSVPPCGLDVFRRQLRVDRRRFMRRAASCPDVMEQMDQAPLADALPQIPAGKHYFQKVCQCAHIASWKSDGMYLPPSSSVEHVGGCNASRQPQCVSETITRFRTGVFFFIRLRLTRGRYWRRSSGSVKSACR